VQPVPTSEVTPTATAGESEPPGDGDPNAVISETARKRLIVVCKEHGRDFAALKTWCGAQGISSTTAIPQRLLEEALTWARTPPTAAREPGSDG
jgi:hypothetical protein